MSDSFKAIVINQSEKEFTREVKSIDKNFLKHGDVLVKVDYSGLNYKDALILRNGAKLVKEFPHIPGIDFSGKVVESENSNYSTGDEVILTGWRVGEIFYGGYSQFAKVKGDFLVKKPKEITTKQAMILGTAGFTALMCSFAVKAKEELFKATYSRIPVYNDNMDNITGILYRHQALKELAQGNQSSLLKDLARPPLFIPEAKPADDLLKQFQQEKRHIAMVVNEFGGVIGLVTTEDLLEEVVGEILDETDITEELIKRIGKNQILVSGRTEARKINEFLKVELDEEEQNTISGLIQQELGHIPSIGEELRVDGCLLIVRDADEKSIKSVQIQKVEEVVQETHKENEDPSPALPLD